ncbi:ATP-binding protein [Natronoarchaeum rubrum]|uniref:ATP-binding protein n=1 Tax=Natronoarchaeum rubrum TaxID=755311 RepID=UPI002113573D|nr:ATP-binding protein [Natronoarchaeum rubrum]
MDEANLLALLNRMNLWWGGEEVQESLKKAEHRRRDFYKIRERLMTSSRPIMTIRGPRQVGKTTLCGQLIESLLTEDQIPSDRILYLTIENSAILSNPEGVIEEAIETFKTNILQKDFRDVDGTVYIFIDEVQKTSNWADTLKYYTDTYSNLQFVATGSISTLIKSDAGDTLIGRMDERVMMPMKFIEYVRYESVIDEETVYDESTELRSKLEESVKEGDSAALRGALSRFFGVYENKKPQLLRLKDEYLLKGGYPSVLNESVPNSYPVLDTDLRNTVTGDLANVFQVETPEKVLRVLSLLAASTGSKVSKSSIAEAADLSRQTVDAYLEHLDEFYLINRCPKYSGSEYSSGGLPKIYLQDVGVYNALNGTLAESTLENPEAMGPIFETAVCDHTRRLQFYLSNAQNADISYYDSGGEVDFVLDGNEYLIPIEVKNGDSTSQSLRGLKRFLEERNAEFGICVNNSDVLDNEDGIIHIPAWMYFFLC